jgi:hypothetical protein
MFKKETIHGTGDTRILSYLLLPSVVPLLLAVHRSRMEMSSRSSHGVGLYFLFSLSDYSFFNISRLAVLMLVT